MTERLLMFVPDTSAHIIPLSVWAVSLLTILIISVTSALVYNHSAKTVSLSSTFHLWSDLILQVIKKPLLFLIGSYILYATWTAAVLYLPSVEEMNEKLTAPYLFKIVEFIVFCWLIFNALMVGKTQLLKWSAISTNATLNLLLPAISSGLQAVIFLIMVNILIPELGLTGMPEAILIKLTKVMLIGMLGWMFVQAVNVLEKIIINQYIVHNANVLTARKINTQVLILKRVVLALGMVVTLGAILMVFDSVKSLGTGLLTTAGIVSAVGAFASQQSLGRLFSGLQIAFTQPIRLGDTVVIDNEMGQVEEITLSYIVVKLWDLRRLILPTDYFTNKGILNLTRESTQLLGTIFLYTDYTLPVETVRAKFHDLVSASKLWDGKVAELQVTDIKESSMELRALLSAENAGTLWKLRCEIREALMKYIVHNHLECLSKSRSLTTNLTKSIPSVPKTV